MAILECPMSGSVWKINVKIGEAVQDGDEMIILDSMKMEVPVIAEDNGTVVEILVSEGDPVNPGDTLVKF